MESEKSEIFCGVLTGDVGMNYFVPVKYFCNRAEYKRFKGRVCEPYENIVLYYSDVIVTVSVWP